MDAPTTYGGIEAGGTKIICATGTGPDDLRAHTRIPTTSPEKTLRRVSAFFLDQSELPAAIGIGSFGPIDANPDSPTYGYITSTPKDGWRHTDVVGTIREAIDVPIAFETDVNAAALAEHRWGAAQENGVFLYLTVGTGIGGCLMKDGAFLYGPAHSEMGHISVPRAPGDTAESVCAYHAHCLEGMASGPAIEARAGQSPDTLPADHEAWTVQTHYLAHALISFIYTVPPERIILGGGVMHQAHLFPKVRRAVLEIMNDYATDFPALQNIDQYIVPPGLGDRAGVLGGVALAQRVAAGR